VGNLLHRLPRWLSGKESACNAGDEGLTPGLEIPGVGIPWRRTWQPAQVFLPGKSMNRGACWSTVHGVTKEKETVLKVN